MSIKKIFNTRGFTLLEVLIFVTLFSMIFLAITYAISLSMRTNISNEKKILATFYAESLSEWIRSEKESNWSSFITQAGLDSEVQSTYCFNSDTLFWTSITGAPPLPTPQIYKNNCNTDYALDYIYNREINLQKTTGITGDVQVNTSINVSWRESQSTQSINVNTLLSQWD